MLDYIQFHMSSLHNGLALLKKSGCSSIKNESCSLQTVSSIAENSGTTSSISEDDIEHRSILGRLVQGRLRHEGGRSHS